MYFLNIVLSFVILFGCSSKEGPRDSRPKTSQIKTQTAEIGVLKVDPAARALAISTSEPRASRIAASIFAEGGNIVDAAVAASFAISTIRQQSTGLGGGGFLIHFQAQNKQAVAWDMREQAPILADEKMYQRAQENASSLGVLSVATPGLLAGLWSLHQAHGQLDWKTLVEPSILLARQGVRVSELMAKALQKIEDKVKTNPDFQKIFFQNGKPLQKGDLLVQIDLAQTLQKIAKAPMDYFYRGEFADRLETFMKKEKGLLTKDDMVNYQVKKREPIRAFWKGLEIVTMPPPSSGGIHLVQILKAYDYLGKAFPDSYEGKTPNGRKIGTMVGEIEVFKRAFADRSLHLGDPDFYPVPVKELLSDTHLLQWAAEIKAKGIIDSDKVKPSVLGKGVEGADVLEGDQTTHLSFMDQDGNVISSTQTLNTYFGSTLVLPETGIVLNNEMDDFAAQPGKPNSFGLVGAEANKVAPRKRPLSSMTPTIVLDSNQEALLALGAPGGSRIITSVYFVLSRILRDGWAPSVAVETCRFHQQWKPVEVFIEEACAEDLSPLETYYPVNVVAGFFGEVQVVGKTSTGQLYSVTDPRGHGEPLIWVEK